MIEDPQTGKTIIQLVQKQNDPITGETKQVVSSLPQNFAQQALKTDTISTKVIFT